MKLFKTILFLLLIICSNGFAQYLLVSRSATVKELPDRDASIIERMQKGDYL